MIAEYDADGRIFHIVQDPVHPGLAAILTEMNKPFLDLPPIPLPDVPLLGQDGEPVYDIETTELFEEDGVTPRRDENGEQLFEVKKTPRMITGRTQSVAVTFEDHYALSGELAERPTLPVPAQIDLTLGQTHDFALPVQCKISVDGQPAGEGASLSIEAEEVASFAIQFEAWPYKTAICEVTVRAA